MAGNRYLVRSPTSGAWFLGPLKGVTPHMEEAHPYPEDDGWLEHMVRGGVAFNKKLRLRQVHSPHEELKRALERDIEATPAPEYVECPDCEGEGELRSDSLMMMSAHWCDRCGGEGRLKVQGPTCKHGIQGPCTYYAWIGDA